MENFIKSVKASIAPFFKENETIFFIKKAHGLYIFGSNNQSTAYDYHKNDKDDINVVKWFDNYWIFMRTCFTKISIDQKLSLEDSKSGNKISKKDYLKKLSENHLIFGNDFFQTQITISLFEGDYDPESKIQLFRAEWDNFDNFTKEHPQPHWHFYQSNVHAEDNSRFQPTQKEGFLETIKKEKIDLRKFHFAMNGNWTNDIGHFHKINDKNALLNWYQGLLSHIKNQLEYIK